MAERKLRVLIDARMMIGRFSGVGRYVTRLIDELAKTNDLNLVALCAAGGAERWLERDDVETIVSSFCAADRPASRRVEWDALYLRRLVRDSGADLFHATWNTGIPALCPTPSVLTIHDLIPWHDPDPHFATRWQRTCYRYAQRASARRATKIVTVSDYVRREVLDELNVDGSKVHTVHNGVDIPDAVESPPVPHRYVLYVGGHEPRKNLAGLFRAMGAFWKRFPERLMLHVTGTPETMDDQAKQAFTALAHKERVRFLGAIDDRQLSGQYASARALITLSLDEGFGLPVLEAMAHGCPVICANQGALREVVGQAGVLVDPRNIPEIVESLHRVTSEVDAGMMLVERGLRHAKRFSWAKTAAGVRSLYERVVSQHVVAGPPSLAVAPGL